MTTRQILWMAAQENEEYEAPRKHYWQQWQRKHKGEVRDDVFVLYGDIEDVWFYNTKEV